MATIDERFPNVISMPFPSDVPVTGDALAEHLSDACAALMMELAREELTVDTLRAAAQDDEVAIACLEQRLASTQRRLRTQTITRARRFAQRAVNATIVGLLLADVAARWIS